MEIHSGCAVPGGSGSPRTVVQHSRSAAAACMHTLQAALLVILIAQARLATAQSLLVDWSQVTVDADGHAAFGPRVDVPAFGEPPPSLNSLLGFYKNSDGF